MPHVRKGDEVIVVAGKDKGKRGKVLHVDLEKNRVKVERVNMIKKHVKASQKVPQGGRVEKEGTIHISNVRLWDSKAQAPCRTGVQIRADKKKVRISKKSGEVFEQ